MSGEQPNCQCKDGIQQKPLEPRLKFLRRHPQQWLRSWCCTAAQEEHEVAMPWSAPTKPKPLALAADPFDCCSEEHAVGFHLQDPGNDVPDSGQKATSNAPAHFQGQQHCQSPKDNPESAPLLSHRLGLSQELQRMVPNVQRSGYNHVVRWDRIEPVGRALLPEKQRYQCREAWSDPSGNYPVA